MCLQLLLLEGKVSLGDTWAWMSELCLLPPSPLGKKINKLKEQGGYKYWGGSWYAAEQGSEVGLLVTPFQLKALSLTLHFICMDGYAHTHIYISVCKQVKRKKMYFIFTWAQLEQGFTLEMKPLQGCLMLRQVISLGFALSPLRVLVAVKWWFDSDHKFSERCFISSS